MFNAVKISYITVKNWVRLTEGPCTDQRRIMLNGRATLNFAKTGIVWLHKLKAAVEAGAIDRSNLIAKYFFNRIIFNRTKYFSTYLLTGFYKVWQISLHQQNFKIWKPTKLHVNSILLIL